MGFKFFALAAVLATASAGILAPAAPVVAPVVAKAPFVAAVPEDYDPNPQYQYGYDIQDTITGDNKNQQETRNGDIVTGSYSLNDADGYRRTVEYTSDPLHGFNAIVRREPLVAAAAPAPVVAKVAAAPVFAAAPVLAKVSTPVVAKVAYPAPAYAYHAAPVAKIAAPLAYAPPAPLAYAAPVAKFAAPLTYAQPIAKVAAPFAYTNHFIH